MLLNGRSAYRVGACGIRHFLSIHFSPVTDSDHLDYQSVLKQRVDNPVVANPDSIVVLAASELATSLWNRIRAKAANGFDDAGDDFAGQLAKFLLRTSLSLNPV